MIVSFARRRSKYRFALASSKVENSIKQSIKELVRVSAYVGVIEIQATPTKQDLGTSWYPHPFHMRALPSPLDSCILLVLLFSHNLVPRAFSVTIFKMVEEKALGTRLIFPCCVGKFFKANNFSTTEDTIQLSLKQNICFAHVNR